MFTTASYEVSFENSNQNHCSLGSDPNNVLYVYEQCVHVNFNSFETNENLLVVLNRKKVYLLVLISDQVGFD